MPKRAGRPPGLVLDGHKIRQRRIELGLTGVQLAAQVGLHKMTISRAESMRPMDPVTAVRVARALGVKVEDLLKVAA